MKKLAAVLCFITTAVFAEVPEPAGFRGPPYNAEVPPGLSGAQTITAPEAHRLHDQGVPFVDVLPRQTRPEELPEGTIWHVPPHQTIPGAVWLFDTGYEAINPTEEARLADGLAQVTKGDKDAPFVIFCKAHCWMSWNAGKRAVALGYRGVHWFPGGVEGWQDEGGALVTAQPDAPPEVQPDAR